MTNRFFRLPFSFDAQRLRDEYTYCKTLPWKHHFNQSDYSGDWSIFSLRSASGRSDDIFAHTGSAAFADAPVLNHCPYFRSIIDQFHCEKETIRLMALAPGSRIKEHRDIQTGYPYGSFRIHIPIQTAPEVSFRVDGVDLPMQVGECWYANFDLPHSVANNGRTDRVHLVIDGLRNAWSDELFGRAGYDFAEEKRRRQPSLETRQRMIDELLRQDTPTARQLAAQLQTEGEAES